MHRPEGRDNSEEGLPGEVGVDEDQAAQVGEEVGAL